MAEGPRIEPTGMDAAADRPTMRGARVLLRAPRPSDKADRLAIGRGPECHRLFGGDPSRTRPLTAEDADRWYEEERACPFAWVVDLHGCCVGAARP